MSQKHRDGVRVRGRIAAATVAMALTALVGAASPAAAQDECSGEGVTLCGFVWNDVNNNGVQDPGEGGVEGATVSLFDTNDSDNPILVGTTETDSLGLFSFDQVPPGPYSLAVSSASIHTSAVPSPTDSPVAPDDTVDSDGTDDGKGNSAVSVIVAGIEKPAFDFGFHVPPVVVSAGTGTPGYWKNHPEAWPGGVTVGGVSYTTTQAIALMGKVAKDKTITIFSSLLAATLNVTVGGTNASCISSTIDAANAWMVMHPPGSGVPASSQAWTEIETQHKQLDDYNNGRLCAPHRD
jgi:hypothetical protein